MSGTTPRLALYTPADDGSEPINVATDLNDNLERIDNAVGFVPSTSAVEPTSPFDGMATYETDTGVAKFRKALTSSWAQLLAAGSTFASNILLNTANKIGIGIGSPVAILDVVVSTITANPLIKFKQASESQPRLQIDYDGIRLGGGSSTTDARIYRPSAAQLNFTGNAVMENTLSVTGDTSVGVLSVSGDITLGGDVVTDLNVVGDISATGKGYTRIIRKTADTLRTSTTTAAVDPDLLVTLEANTTYLIELNMFMSGTAGDLKTSWNMPAGALMYRWALGPDVGATSNANISMRSSVHLAATEVTYGVFSESSWSGASETIVIFMSSTAGVVQLKFAQNSSSATPSGLRAASFMKVTRIE